MKIFKLKKIEDNKKGFTLLFAILVSIMVLAVGASIINISLKQVILSSSGRESQFAFYAANTGLECALFWDLNGVIVEDDGTAKYVFPPPGNGNLLRDDVQTFDCSRTNIATGDSGYVQDYTTDWVVTNNQQTSQTIFKIAISNEALDVDDSGLTIERVMYCAEVTVLKEIIDDNGSISTTITSRGLNTCDPDNDSRAVERGLVLQYRS
jgi:hypothetical protein